MKKQTLSQINFQFVNFHKVLIISLLSIIFFSQNTTAQRKRMLSRNLDKGDVKVVWTKVSNQDYAEFQEDLKKQRLMEGMAKYLNDVFSMPQDLFITCSECGEENAFYDKTNKKITICYEMIDYLYDVLDKKYKDEKLDEAVWNATTFILCHELGHALIDIYDLPVTGREEDTVDNFSAYFLTTTGDDAGSQAAIDGAFAFKMMAEEAAKALKTNEIALWDVHSLDAQRFYNVVCMVYGSNPKKFQALVKKGYLPANRAVSCEDEYGKMASSWDKVLDPWIKPATK